MKILLKRDLNSHLVKVTSMTKVVSRFFCCNNARSKYRGLYRPFISTVRYFNGRICLQEPVYNGKKRKNAYYDNYSENSINE